MNAKDRISAQLDRLSKADRIVAAHITNGYPSCLLDSATHIAKSVGVSPSTVVRFFAKLGYQSFSEAQREARSEVASQLPTPAQRAAFPHTKRSPAHGHLDSAIAMDKQNIDQMRAAIDEEAFGHLIDLIARPRQGTIYLAAAKNSLSVAVHLAVHLNMCLPNIELLSADAALLADRLLWVKPNDALLAFSIRRYSSAVYRAAQSFAEVGADVVAVTDSPNAPINQFSTLQFQIFTKSDSPFDSCISAFSLCTAIINAVAQRRHKSVNATLRRGEVLWKRFGIFTESQS